MIIRIHNNVTIRLNQDSEQSTYELAIDLISKAEKFEIMDNKDLCVTFEKVKTS